MKFPPLFSILRDKSLGTRFTFIAFYDVCVCVCLFLSLSRSLSIRVISNPILMPFLFVNRTGRFLALMVSLFVTLLFPGITTMSSHFIFPSFLKLF